MLKKPLVAWRRRFPAARTAVHPVADRLWLGRVPSGVVRDALVRLAGTRLGLGLLRAILKDPKVRGELVISLSELVAGNARFDDAMRAAGAVPAPSRFDDLVWLFSSNPLNHRLARLDLDEAAYLYRLVRSLDSPLVAELGRFRGGTTVLLAAAGAEVVSVDNHPRQPEWSRELAGALERLGLRERVEIVEGDTNSHPPGPGPYQVVVFDASVRREPLRAEVRNWWPALGPGGHAIFRDGRPKLPHLAPVGEVVAEVGRYPDAQRLPDNGIPGWLVHVTKRS